MASKDRDPSHTNPLNRLDQIINNQTSSPDANKKKTPKKPTLLQRAQEYYRQEPQRIEQWAKEIEKSTGITPRKK